MENSPGTIHFLLVISGITCKEEKLEDPVELNNLMNNAKSQYVRCANIIKCVVINILSYNILYILAP